jgi:hypothetical protein
MTIIDAETAIQMLYEHANARRVPYNPARWTTSKTFVPDFVRQEAKFIPDPAISTDRVFIKDPIIN